MSTDEPQSWADSIKKYENETRFKPAPQGEDIIPKRAFRDSRFNKKEQERQFDPIRGKYINNTRENHLQVAEIQQKLDHRAKAERVRVYETPYNILTGHVRSGKHGHFQEAPKEVSRELSRAPLFPYPREKTPEPKQGRVYKNKVSRGFDMITNKFMVDNESREEKERVRQLEYSKTKRITKNVHGLDPYNPIIGVYCDGEVEQKYKEEVAQNTLDHRINAIKRLPARSRISEGMLYNILSLKPNAVFLPEQKRQAEIKSRTPEPTLGLIHNKMVRERDYQEQDLTLRRATNRISSERWQSMHRRGYDITSNEVLPSTPPKKTLYVPTIADGNPFVRHKDDGPALQTMVDQVTNGGGRGRRGSFGSASQSNTASPQRSGMLEPMRGSSSPEPLTSSPLRKSPPDSRRTTAQSARFNPIRVKTTNVSGPGGSQVVSRPTSTRPSSTLPPSRQISAPVSRQISRPVSTQLSAVNETPQAARTVLSGVQESTLMNNPLLMQG